MNRREFHLLSLAGLAAMSLPQAAEAAIGPPADDPGPRGEPGLPGVDRCYLTVTGGKLVYVTGRSVPKSTTTASLGHKITGIVLSVSGYLAGKENAYSLHRVFLNGLTDPDKVVKSFERLRTMWSPMECLIEADGLAEKLLGDQLGVRRVGESCPSLEELDAPTKVLADFYPPRHPTQWNYVGAREPDFGNTFRKIFPVRLVQGPVSGEAEEALRHARLLEDIHQRCLIMRHGKV